jgi:ketosteroid isomerase-like protein
VTHALGRSIVLAIAFLGVAAQGTSSDQQAVAKLDTDFQAAVKVNDAQAMARIMHKDMILVLGNGSINTREEQLEEARNKEFVYEHQEEDAGTQMVRVSGDTAVVTARLWVKGVYRGMTYDRRLWFSDTYVRTSEGWRYFVGQASLHLPDEKATQ